MEIVRWVIVGILFLASLTWAIFFLLFLPHIWIYLDSATIAILLCVLVVAIWSVFNLR